MIHHRSKLVVDEIKSKFSWCDNICPFYIEKIGNINSSTIPLGLNIKNKKEKCLSGNFIFSGFGGQKRISSSSILIQFEKP